MSETLQKRSNKRKKRLIAGRLTTIPESKPHRRWPINPNLKAYPESVILSAAA